jgi:hypothetical protein
LVNSSWHETHKLAKPRHNLIFVQRADDLTVRIGADEDIYLAHGNAPQSLGLRELWQIEFGQRTKRERTEAKRGQFENIAAG